MNNKTIQELMQCYENKNQKAVLDFWRKRGLIWPDLDDKLAFENLLAIYKVPLLLSKKGLSTLVLLKLSTSDAKDAVFNSKKYEVNHDENGTKPIEENDRNSVTNYSYISIVASFKLIQWVKIFRAISNGERYRKIAFLAEDNYQFDDAILAYNKELSIYSRGHLKGIKELDIERAELKFFLGSIYRKKSDFKQALSDYEQAFAIYNRPQLKNLHRLDVNRATILLNRGLARKELGDVNYALQDYKQALSIYNQKYLKNQTYYDLERGKLYLNMGVAHYEAGELSLALHNYKEAFTIYDRSHLKHQNRYASERAKLYTNCGVVHQEKGELKLALDNYEQALIIFDSLELINKYKFDLERAALFVNLGVAHHEAGELSLALHDYGQSLSIYDRLYLQNQNCYDLERAKLYLNRGTSHADTGDLSSAIDDFQNSLNIYHQPNLKDQLQYDSERAKLHANLGNVYILSHEIAKALQYFTIAIEIYHQSHLISNEKYGSDLAALLLNRGNAHKLFGNPDKAIEDYHFALEILNQRNIADLSPQDFVRALLLSNRGNLYEEKKYPEGAIKDYGSAIEIYEQQHLKNQQHDSDRVELYLKRGNIYLSSGEQIKAIKDHLNVFNILAEMASLLSNFTNALDWSRDKSARLVNLLELAPFARHDSVDHPMWREMRSNFALFHARWLAYCIDEGHYDEIPRILFAVQGRELVREVYEELREFDPDAAHPESVIRFFELRRQLREMLNRQPGMDSSLGGGFDDITRGPQRLDPEQANAQYLAQLDAHQRQYQALHTQMRDVQAKAALEKGYEDLAQQDHDHGLDDLINLSGFTDRQALLLMVDYQAGNSNEGNQSIGDSGLLLIFKDGNCQWLGAEFLGDISDQMIRLRRTLETDSMRGPLRRDISEPVGADADNSFVPLTVEERHRFWPQMVKQLKAQLWQPILDQLADKSIDEIIIMPQGRWHQMPIEAGAPEDVSIRYYPGLVFYGLAQGLFGSPRDTSADIDVNRQAFGLVAYSAMDHLNTTLALPGVEQEVKALETLYAEGSCRLKSPEEFPEQPRSIEMFHFAGHGNTDPGNDSSTALLVGYDHERKSDQYVGMHALRKGKTNVKYALINACVTGEIKENQHGTPSGIVTGLLRQGTQSVTAALYPLNDTYAVVFGEAFQRLWRQERQETGNVDVHCILKQSIDELIERGQIRVREDVNQALYSIVESELEGYDEVRPDYIAKIIEDLVNYQPVLVPYADEIKATLTTITSCDDMKPRLDDLMHHLDDQGAFQFDPEHRLPDDLGMITHGLRVFG